MKHPAMENRLGALGAQIDELLEQAQGTVDATRTRITHSLAEELRTWRELGDELRVQSALGSMEARQRLAPVIERAEKVVAELREKFPHAHGAEYLEDLEESVQRSLGDLRRELEAGGMIR